MKNETLKNHAKKQRWIQWIILYTRGIINAHTCINLYLQQLQNPLFMLVQK